MATLTEALGASIIGQAKTTVGNISYTVIPNDHEFSPEKFSIFSNVETVYTLTGAVQGGEYLGEMITGTLPQIKQYVEEQIGQVAWLPSTPKD